MLIMEEQTTGLPMEEDMIFTSSITQTPKKAATLISRTRTTMGNMWLDRQPRLLLADQQIATTLG